MLFLPGLAGQKGRRFSGPLRRSFAQWHQLVEQTCDPWTEADLVARRVIGETVKDVILQFRSAGMLIANQQMERVRGQVRRSDLPVAVADEQGAILLVNDAFQAIIGGAGRAPGQLADLPGAFIDPAEFSRRLRDLTQGGQAWRGEASLRAGAQPLLVCADPVLASPGEISGFVLLFTDLIQRKAAEAARQSFEERILGRGRLASRFDPEADVVMQNLFASVVENAQLAALQITDGVDLEAIPAMLDSVRASVARTKRALDHLILHANSLARDAAP